jgi:hypothetical protein
MIAPSTLLEDYGHPKDPETGLRPGLVEPFTDEMFQRLSFPEPFGSTIV